MSKKWTILAKEPRAHIFPTSLYWLGAQRSGIIVKVPIKRMCFIYKNHTLIEAVEKGSLVNTGKRILKLLAKDSVFLNKIVTANKKYIPILLVAAKKFDSDLSKLTNSQLANLWEDYTDKFQELMSWSAMGTVLEYEYPVLSKYLENILKKRIVKVEEVGHAMSVLSTPVQVTSSQKEVRELMGIKLSPAKEGDKKLEKHCQKYSWLAFGYDGPGWSLADFKKRFRELPRDKNRLRKLLKAEKDRVSELKIQQRLLAKKYKLSKREARLFETLRTLGYWKFERKFMLQKTQAQAEKFIREVARRKFCSVPQIKMLAPWEMRGFLLNDKPLFGQRIKLCVIEMTGSTARVIQGEKAAKLDREVNDSVKINEHLKQLQGDVAYPGKVSGCVKLIEEARQISKFKKGEILVSSTTNPELIPAMKKAAAIITDAGGITSHAAIISRELKIPCIIGTKIATRVLKDDNKVLVDADKGLIKKL